MKITYETGIATLVQFVALSLLNIAYLVVSIVSTCHSKHDSCLTNSLSSILYFMLIVICFAVIWLIGFRAQSLRSRRLCILLIGIEFFVFVITLYDAKGNKNLLGLLIDVINALLAVWVIALAIRLMRARGGRIVASERSRARRRPSRDNQSDL